MSGMQADDQLLRRSRLGDEGAFAELVDRHGDYLFGIARALVRSDHDAEDAVQECLMASLKAPYDGDAAVRTWLVGILVRQAALVRRKRFRWSRESEQPARPPQQDASSAVDARLDLAQMLQQLSPEHREVIVLRELEQMSYDEMAQALSVPRGTIESRLFRAREELRKRHGGGEQTSK